MRGRLLFTIVLLSPWLFGITITWVGDGANGWATGDDLDAANLQLVKPVFDDHDTRLGLIEANGWVTSTRIFDSSVTTAKILDANVTAAKVAADVATQAELDAVSAAKQAGPLTGAVTTSGAGSAATTLANDAVTTTKILDSSVTAAKIGSDAVTTVKILNGNVTAAKVAADVATQGELDAKSAATSTDNAVVRFDSTTGDEQNSGVLIDDTNNVIVPGTLTVGGLPQGSMTTSATAPTDGSTACGAPGEVIRLVTAVSGTCTSAPCIYYCVNEATDEWAGNALGLD